MLPIKDCLVYDPKCVSALIVQSYSSDKDGYREYAGEEREGYFNC
jgi:hypothetical protein